MITVKPVTSKEDNNQSAEQILRMLQCGLSVFKVMLILQKS